MENTYFYDKNKGVYINNIKKIDPVSTAKYTKKLNKK